MLGNFLKKSEDLITWWKLEWGVTIISFSFLTVIVGIGTDWSVPKVEDPIPINTMLENKPILIVVAVTMSILVILFIIGLFKCFKVLSFLNKSLREVTEITTMQILKKLKLLLTSIICLTLFPIFSAASLRIVPHITSVLVFATTICKVMFYKNNKVFRNLVNIDEENQI